MRDLEVREEREALSERMGKMENEGYVGTRKRDW